VTLHFIPDPAKTFNRGYRSFFLNGRTRRCASLKTPGWTGEHIGAVVAAGARSFELAPTCALHNGDGICFFDAHGELRGTVVNRVSGTAVFPASMAGIRPGTVVYRNHDRQFLQQLARRPAERRIGLWFEFEETAEGVAVRVRDEDGNTAGVTCACDKTPAAKPDAAAGTIKRQLAKLGGTRFYCNAVSIAGRSVCFLPVSVLNRLRREAVAALVRVRAENRPVKRGGALRNSVPFPERRLRFADNVLNRTAAAFYRRHGVETIEPAAESGISMNGRKVMTARYCIMFELGMCRTAGGRKDVGAPLHLVDQEGRRFRLHFDCAACHMEVFAPEEPPAG